MRLYRAAKAGDAGEGVGAPSVQTTGGGGGVPPDGGEWLVGGVEVENSRGKDVGGVVFLEKFFGNSVDMFFVLDVGGRCGVLVLVFAPGEFGKKKSHLTHKELQHLFWFPAKKSIICINIYIYVCSIYV